MKHLLAFLVEVALVLIPGEKTLPEKCFLKCYGEGLDMVIICIANKDPKNKQNVFCYPVYEWETGGAQDHRPIFFYRTRRHQQTKRNVFISRSVLKYD